MQIHYYEGEKIALTPGRCKTIIVKVIHKCASMAKGYASCRMFLYPEWILCSSSPSVPRWESLS